MKAAPFGAAFTTWQLALYGLLDCRRMNMAKGSLHCGMILPNYTQN